MLNSCQTRHEMALDLSKSPNISLSALTGLLLGAIEEVRREGHVPESDPAVRLIAAKFSDVANVTADDRILLLQECEQRLAEFVSRPKLLQIIEAPVAASPERKEAYHREVQTLLRELVGHIGLSSGTFIIRSNKGGPAVSGEITLHAPTFYVQVSQTCFLGQEILFRRCNGTTDYVGGPNYHAPITALCSPEVFARRILRELHLMDEPSSGKG